MSNKIKNESKKAQVENVEAQATVMNREVESAPTQRKEESVEDKVAKAKAEAEELMAKAKAAAEAAKQAAKEAKEAAKKAKAFTSRPVRKSYFVAYYEDNEEACIGKGDVHYCVEKSAIDEVIRQREFDDELRTVCLYKVNKSEPEKDRILISKVYIDQETKQVVID